MSLNHSDLQQIVNQRAAAAGTCAKNCLDLASEVIVFGSMSASLDGPESDIDILCIGQCAYKLKTNLLDLIVIPREVAKSSAWLESELATHIAAYGAPLRGQSGWRQLTRIGQSAIHNKSRRVTSFLKSLPGSWLRLNEGFRVKYSVKLRRETQRLILLEQGIPIPPTKILDSFWEGISRSRYEVQDRLLQMSPDRHSTFTRDLLARIEAHFDANKTLRPLVPAVALFARLPVPPLSHSPLL